MSLDDYRIEVVDRDGKEDKKTRFTLKSLLDRYM